MTKRSRRSHGSSISLFSFQDIMMSVMGILILMTLMMSLELVETLAQNPAPAASRNVVIPDLQNLTRELVQLQQEYEDAKKHLLGLTKASNTSPADFEAEKTRLEQRYVEVRRLQQQVMEIQKNLPAKINANRRFHEAQVELRRIEIAVEQLRQSLDLQRKNPRLSYIIQPGQGKVPILCILNDQKIGLGEVDSASPAIWFTHAPPSSQIDALKTFLQQCDSRKRFVVILLKPSAFKERYQIVRSTIIEAGFDVGLDLISEQDTVLPGE